MSKFLKNILRVFVGRFPADLVTFTEEILNGKHHFLCGEYSIKGKRFLSIP